MSVIGKLLALLLLAPPTVEDIPPIDRSRPDFYQAICENQKLDISWELSSSSVRADTEVLLILKVRNCLNPEEVLVPPLGKLFPELARFVQILPSQRQLVDRDLLIRYPLRPLAPSGIVAIPSLKFVYYRADFPEELRFQTTYTKTFELKVIPAATANVDSVVSLDGPERFFQLRKTGVSVNLNWVWLTPLMPIMLIPLGVWGWRRIFPDAAKLALLQRNRAARRAWRELQAARQSSSVVSLSRLAILGYFQSRFGLSTSAQIRKEILEGLEGQPRELLRELEFFLEQCDQESFATPTDNALSIADSAQSLLVKWESSFHSRPMSRPLLLTILCFCCVSAGPAANQAELAFETGVNSRQNTAIAREHFRNAAQLYSDTSLTVTSATNQARAYFLAGDAPRALRSIHDGLALAPWDRELHEDLQFIRNRVAYPSLAPQMKPVTSQRIVTRVGPADLLLAATALSILLTLFAIRAILFRQRLYLILSLSIALLYMLTLGVTWRLQCFTPPLMRVVQRPCQLLSGNGPSYEPRLSEPLPAGAEVEEITRRGSWVLVLLPDGTRGWLIATHLL
jgi:hypothetical protein